MPFIQQTPRIFTKRNIEAVDPNQVGVYGIFRNDLWIYIGKGDIKERLLAHLGGDNPCILKSNPTHWVGEIRSDPEMSIREKQLIVEFRPSCNQKIG